MLRRELGGGVARLRPGVSGYFNDPAGAFKYEISALASYDRPFAGNRFVNLELKGVLYENVSDVTQPSNSTLPHVRTDIAEYKRGNDVKLMRALAHQHWHPAPRVYSRVSAGIYEEMYAGAGGQALYLSRDGGWSADLAVDALRQRDFEGWFGFLDYSTVTAIASLNYRMAQGVTGTVRAGRFLAKDEGVRVEVKRRFASGFEVGAWYTVTNGNDITSPGTPDSPYHDKGIFMQMALNTMMTRDSRATANFSLAPWTRDVGQMVQSPGRPRAPARAPGAPAARGRRAALPRGHAGRLRPAVPRHRAARPRLAGLRGRGRGGHGPRGGQDGLDGRRWWWAAGCCSARRSSTSRWTTGR